MHSLSLHASTIASLQPTLSPRLQRAVRLLQLSSQDFARVVRDALDSNPFLELTIALRLVQAFDPAGIGARNVAECLQLQVRAAPAGPTRSLAEAILASHLQALAAGDLRALARRLAQPLAAVEAACAAIRRLDPHPGWRFSEPAVQYVTPDIIVRKIRGQSVATLNEAVVPRVKVNRGYVELFQRHREARHAEAPGQPLSDVEIARQLARQGLQVARRTVTKYRQLLKIEPAERRRGRCAAGAGLGKGEAHGF